MKRATLINLLIVALVLAGVVGLSLWRSHQERRGIKRAEELLRMSREGPVLDLRSPASPLAEEKRAWQEYQRLKREAERAEEEGRELERLREEVDAALAAALAASEKARGPARRPNP